MKNILLLYTLILLSSCSEDKNRINVSNWEDNSENIYKVVESEFRFENDSIIKNEATEYYAKSSLIEMGKQPKLEWLICDDFIERDTISENFNLEADPSICESGGIKIQYEVNELGQYIEISNMTELKQQLKSIWTNSLNLPIEQMDSLEALRQIESIFLSDEGIEGKTAKNVLLLHMIYGYNFNTNSVHHVKNSIFGHALDSDINYSVLYDDERYTSIEVIQIFDPDDSMTYLNSIISEFINDEPKSNVNISDTTIVAFDKQIGWPIQIKSWRTIEMDNLFSQSEVHLFKTTF